MAYQNALRFYGTIAYCDEYNGILFDADQGRRLAASLGEEKRIIFHKHHGIIVIGRTIAEAFEDLYFLERTCRLQWIAKTYAGTLDVLPADKVAKIMREFNEQERGASEIYASKYFRALRRVLDRTEPDYAD
jgi:ribulose-5-phosphate 4-epimerase/fuculose-1-phosphate aldolase